jgi:uncharacterized alpha-E superfamily protein
MAVNCALEQMATKMPRVVFYCSEETKEGLEKLAKKEKRSLSNYLMALCSDIVEQAKAEGKI